LGKQQVKADLNYLAFPLKLWKIRYTFLKKSVGTT